MYIALPNLSVLFRQYVFLMCLDIVKPVQEHLGVLSN